MTDLVRALVEAHGEGATGIRYAGRADATVDGHAAMLLALVVGELTNNSLKYSALRNGKPVLLSWSLDQEALCFHWREPLSVKGGDALQPRDSGSGYSMMQRMARAQRATFAHAITIGDLTVTLTLASKQ